MTTPDPFLHDDAAYVLEALSDDDRRDFEAHLLTCFECRDRVTEMQATAGLLGDLTAADLNDPRPEDVTVPDTMLPALLRAVRRERVRRRWFGASAGAVAAACIVALVIALAGSDDTGTGGSTPVAMHAVVAGPVHASAQLTDVDWGTRITLACRYDSSYPASGEYDLVVTDRSGGQHSAGSWTLQPGKVIHYTGGTALHRDQIASIAVTRGTTKILELTL